MAVPTIPTRAFALFLLCFGIAMAIAALADKNWADNPQLAGQYGRYRLGLRQVSSRQSTRRAQRMHAAGLSVQLSLTLHSLCACASLSRL